MMRRGATPRRDVEPHDRGIVVGAQSAASRYDVRHQDMTILDGLRNIFEVNCLICTDRC